MTAIERIVLALRRRADTLERHPLVDPGLRSVLADEFRALADEIEGTAP